MNYSNSTEDALQSLRTAISLCEFWLPLIILAFGFPGNMCGMLIMLLQPDNRSRPTCIFMGAISVVEFFIISFILFPYWLFFISLTHTSFYLACTFIHFLMEYLTQLAIYILVAMTADRFLSIRFPFHMRTLRTIRNVKLSIITITGCLSSSSTCMAFGPVN